MTQPEHIPRTRDADRSRTTILEAATTLFAAHGFEATTMQQIAIAASVARGTPSYFFGSKENLFKAVLEQQNQIAMQIVPKALERVTPEATSRELLELFIDVYLDFHAEHPQFLKLIHWCILQDNHLIDEVNAHMSTVSSMIQAILLTVQGSKLETEDPRQIALSIVGLCNAHLSYGKTLALPLGLNVDDPSFLEARRAHLKRSLLALFFV
jgi:TetR/AcrR family transcriptional regulator